jgi:glycosyltransferase involved in cell wall biosynthesis
MEKYNGRIANLKYIHNEKPYGHIFNWNVAINMATGEYIKIMFSDDWFTGKDSLAEFVNLLDTNSKAIFAFSGSRQVNVSDMSSYDRYAPKEYIDRLKRDYRYLFQSNQIGAPSAIIYRRDKDGQITFFDEKSNWASDVFLYFNLFGKSQAKSNANANAFAYTEKPLVSIGVHANQYTETFSEHDMRIYNDYKYMYTKYNLAQSSECREYFAAKYIVKYHQSIKEAKSLGIKPGIVIVKYVLEFMESIKCFIGSRLKVGSK